MFQHIVKSEVAHLISEIETLESYCKVARERALELYTKMGYSYPLTVNDQCVSAHELIRVATNCQVSAAKIDLLISIDK